jgi:hypothetical protein
MAITCNGKSISDEKVRNDLNTPVNVLTFIGNYFSSYGNYQFKKGMLNRFLAEMPTEATPSQILANLVNYDVLEKVRNFSTSKDYSIETPDNLLCGRWNPYQYLFDKTISALQKQVNRRMTMQEELDEFVTQGSKVNDITQSNKKYEKYKGFMDFLASFFISSKSRKEIF